MPKLIRITTVPISLKKLLTGQMQYMQKNGFEVIMMSANGREREEVIAQESCPHIVIPMTRKITLIQDLYCLILLVYHFIKIRPDIVHSHTPKAGLLAMLAAWITRVPVRLHTVAGLPLMASSGFKLKLLIFIEKITYAAATLVLPNSNSLKKYIADNRFCKNDKLDIIGKGSSNGIDISEFERGNLSPEILEQIKTEIQYDSQFKYLLAVGRIVKDKGIVELIEVFERISLSYHGKLKLILVGSYEMALDPIPVSTLKIIDSNRNIISIGFSNKVPYFMRIADIFVHPSHREGFPNVLLQAGVMKCPILCSNICGNIDIVENDQEGLLFEVKDVICLKKQLLYSLQYPEQMQQKAEQLYKKIITFYDRNAIHELIYHKYLFLLGSNDKKKANFWRSTFRTH